MKKRRMKQEPLFSEAEHQRPDAVFTLRCEASTLRKLRDKAKEKGISANAFVRLAVVHALTFDVVQVGTRR